MVMVMKPLHDAANVRRVLVSTYQSVSGAGIAATQELRHGMQAWLNKTPEESMFSLTRSQPTLSLRLDQQKKGGARAKN